MIPDKIVPTYIAKGRPRVLCQPTIPVIPTMTHPFSTLIGTGTYDCQYGHDRHIAEKEKYNKKKEAEMDVRLPGFLPIFFADSH